jgi:Cu+-exporting ATPase
MTCASCTSLIEKESSRLKGLQKINVSFSSETAYLDFDESFDENQFLDMLTNLGYRAEMDGIKSQKRWLDVDLQKAIILLFVGSLFMGVMFLPSIMHQFHELINYFQVFVSLIIMLTWGRHYFYNLALFFTKFYSDMHTLIGLGLFSNLIYSIYMVYINPMAHLYVEAIPFILGFTILGHFFEKKAKTKAQTSLSNLYKMQIKFASKLVNGEVFSTPVIELTIGDLIRIKPGEKIPVNGIIVKGESHLDEALISGESIPLHKKSGDQIIAGAINLEGSLEVQVTSIFHDSTVAEIIHHLEKAEGNKIKLQLIADKIVAKFVPAILFFAIMTLGIWYFRSNDFGLSLKYFIAVLVIACPCALGLAVPMSVMISTREALKIGMLINGGEVLEIGSQIDTIVFDKTGTLTKGKPKVSKFSILNKNMKSEKEILQLAASSSAYSSHPLSMAIVQYAKESKVEFLDPDKFKNLVGLGFEAKILNDEILMGSLKLMKEKAVEMTYSEESNASSLVYLAINLKLIGIFYIDDPIKEESYQVVADLNKANIDVWMLTGDNQNVARVVADKLKIKNIKYNVSPLEKEKFIEALKVSGKKVAMIGDGINDAIALTKANLSMAMADGSDIAISSSQVSLLNGDISLIPKFFSISKQTMSIIKQNLFFSFIYNLLCIPLAAGAFVSMFGLELDPKWAALSMGLSSTSVILSSLRLKNR